jgi:hypothetical protein
LILGLPLGLFEDWLPEANTPNLDLILVPKCISINENLVKYTFQQVHIYLAGKNTMIVIHCGMTAVKTGFDDAKNKMERFVKWV